MFKYDIIIALDSTFTMANICPQNSALNKGVWSRLEAWIRALLKNNYEEVVVITGPVFAPFYINGKWVQQNLTIGTFPKLIR